MLAMRLQRTGRKGHAQYRVVVQDSRFSPTSGRVVAFLGTFNPHTKETVINKEKATAYLSNGAQPSERLAVILKKEGVKLPKWVSLPDKKKGVIKNADKLRRNRPEEPKDETTTEVETVASAEEQAPAAPEAANVDATPTAEDVNATAEEPTPAEAKEA